ncbi:hypothetical protein BGW80DRAFT_1335591 [Lactifluus volemus]|nr:hypothetical protein BGW80DRAFT_1335591 [Lactifluus volemus]
MGMLVTCAADGDSEYVNWACFCSHDLGCTQVAFLLLTVACAPAILLPEVAQITPSFKIEVFPRSSCSRGIKRSALVSSRGSGATEREAKQRKAQPMHQHRESGLRHYCSRRRRPSIPARVQENEPGPNTKVGKESRQPGQRQVIREENDEIM